MTEASGQEAMKKAIECVQAKKLPQATQIFRQILAEEPDNDQALSSLAAISRQLGRNDLAVGFAGRAVQLKPNSAAYQYNYADAWLAVGEAQQATIAYQRAIAFQPDWAEPHAGLGIALHRLGRWPESASALNRAIELGMRQAGVYVELSKSLMRCGKLDEADSYLKRAEESQPDAAEIWQVRGEILGHRRKYPEAVAAFAHAAKFAPRYARPYHGSGVVLALQGDFQAAATAMRQALALDPNYPEANCGLGAILLRLDRAAEAIPYYEKALVVSPLYLQARADLALAFEKVGRLKDAAAQYEALADATSDDSFFRFQRASLGQDEAPAAAPPQLVARVFDQYASFFDEHLTKFLGYRAPQLIFQAVGRSRPAQKLNILDLGCGTGLCGQLFKPIALTLVGIDLSSAMIEKARQREIYDRLVVGDLLQANSTAADHFGLVTACDVFCYLGDLAPIFRKVTEILRPGGLFAFTVEAIDDGDFVLRQTRRYAHSATYIKQLAKHYAFELLSLDRTALRTENHRDVEGFVALLRHA